MSDSAAPAAAMEVDTPITVTSETVVAAPEASTSTPAAPAAPATPAVTILPEDEEIAAKTLAQGTCLSSSI